MNPTTESPNSQHQHLFTQLCDYLNTKKIKEAELVEIENRGREIMTQILRDVGHGPFRCGGGPFFRIFCWRRYGKEFPTLRFYKDLVW